MRIKLNLSPRKRFFELGFGYGVIVFFMISFGGWCFEKVGRFLVFGAVGDRGFLTMPLCPIYGFTVIFLFILAGTPSAPLVDFIPSEGSLAKRLFSDILDYLMYFVFAFIVANLFELVTGVFFEKAVGVKLWNYSERAFNIGGYVCLGFGAMWGVLITTLMSFFRYPLLSAVRSVGEKRAKAIAVALVAFSICDFCFNIVYTAVTGTHFNFL